MAHCKYCGNEIEDNAIGCIYCGAQFISPAAAPQYSPLAIPLRQTFANSFLGLIMLSVLLLLAFIATAMTPILFTVSGINSILSGFTLLCRWRLPRR